MPKRRKRRIDLQWCINSMEGVGCKSGREELEGHMQPSMGGRHCGHGGTCTSTTARLRPVAAAAAGWRSMQDLSSAPVVPLCRLVPSLRNAFRSLVPHTCGICRCWLLEWISSPSR